MTSASWSNRQIRPGFQNRITITPAAMLETEATMSTSSKPTKFDQRNWTAAKVPPMTSERQPDVQRVPPTGHGPDQPERDQDREQGEDPSARCRSAPRHPAR